MKNGNVKNSEIIVELSRYLSGLIEDYNLNPVCDELKMDYDGYEWCVKDCNKIPDDGCILHLMRMRINSRKQTKPNKQNL